MLTSSFCYELIEALAKAVVSLDPHTIAIITPYKEQMNKIKDMIADSVTISNMVEVNTVDAFQGQEKDIIIFSCVRSRNMHGEKKGIGFLRDTRRLNVALTRAKYCLYVIGTTFFITFRQFRCTSVEHCVEQLLVSHARRSQIQNPRLRY